MTTPRKLKLLDLLLQEISSRQPISTYNSNSSSPGSVSTVSSGSHNDSGVMEVDGEVEQVMGPLDASSELKDVVEVVNAIPQRTHKLEVRASALRTWRDTPAKIP